MIIKRKMTAAALAALMVLTAAVPVSAETSDGNVGYASGVTKEMCTASYWDDRSGVDSDEVLMTKQEIAELNSRIAAGEGTHVTDLVNGISETYDADALSKSLSESSVTTKDLYIGGEMIDKDAYINTLKEAILNTGYTGECSTKYAVAVKIADLRAWPQAEQIGYSAADQDDEFESSALCVNEPFVIRQKCEVNGKTFYWGYSNNCTGWVDAESLAICSSKAEWEEAWKVDVTGNDFIVVTQDKITLDKTQTEPSLSKLTVNMGSVLKLVPESEIPTTVSNRGRWNNYVVYMPVRNEDGTYKRVMALIAQHNSVSVGYEDLTGANVLDIAFSCLGNSYGWGGMNETNDCSAYTRNVYRCFGLTLPRNTTWQRAVPGKVVSISDLTDAQKEAYISKLPAGSMLYFSGHVMIYTGTVDGKPYVISALGSAADSGEGEAVVQTIYSVSLNPLTVRRKSGTTWLANLTDAVVLSSSVPDVVSALYTDMKGYSYAEEAVRYVSAKGILTGTGTDTFSPGAEMSRGMILTALARMDGQDTSGGSVWYEKGVAWAVENGISDGTAPTASVTREQLAAMLYRYLGSPEVTESAKADLAGQFNDADEIDGYAEDAMAWAVENGIITGTDAGTLDPGSTAVRAQLAVMLQRLYEGPLKTEETAA